MTTTLDVQRRLASLGLYSGDLDGIPGRVTQTGVRTFETQHHLPPDGVIDPAFVRALNAATSSQPALGELKTVPWVENLRPYISMQEKRDNRKLSAYLDSDGSTVGDPAKIPWCGDAVQTPLALTLPHEPLPSNPYYAINWATWGVGVPKGVFPMGAVGVKRRLDAHGNLIGGHVFFIVGHDAIYVHALGGNQNNSICIARIKKSDLFALRFPKTYPMGPSMPITTIDATINATEA